MTVSSSRHEKIFTNLVEKNMPEFESSAAEKRHLEHEAAKIFMRRYEKETGHEIRHIWHNQPTRPDVSCVLEGERLDLEIAHLYGSEQEAMKILGRSLTEKTRAELRQQACCSDVHQRLLKALNRILTNKAQKHYDSKKVWLIIRNAHPAWTAEPIINLQDKIHVPVGHPFKQIWIVADFSGESGIVQLFP
tara:strand:+ start:14667 stop:15239 length:573 start_codon:yes stop_codon:yes gene_type:complete